MTRGDSGVLSFGRYMEWDEDLNSTKGVESLGND